MIETYGQLLQDYGVISEITSEEVRGELRYTFNIYERFDFPYPVECYGVKELATILSAMWTTREKTRYDLGLDDHST